MSDKQKDDFIKVSYKRRKKLQVNVKKLEVHSAINENIDTSKIVRRILDIKDELLSSDVLHSVNSLLSDAVLVLNSPKVAKLVCLGLGRVADQPLSRYQLALLLCLQSSLELEISVYDPLFTDNDKIIISSFNNIQIETLNLEGKCRADKPTIFYLPHCPKALMNNLLWTNWGLNLSNCIIVGNSVNKVVEDSLPGDLIKSASLIRDISKCVEEFKIEVDSRFFEVFSDTSIHVFPLDKLLLEEDTFWDLRPEPVYDDEDMEFVRK